MQGTFADKLWSGATTNRVKQAALVVGGSLLLAALLPWAWKRG
jgi:hypothetical protein